MAFAAFSSATAKVQAPTKTGRVALYLLLPGLMYLVLFFLTPLISLIITSLQVPDASGVIGRYQYGFAIENYWLVIEGYLPQILRSFAFGISPNASFLSSQLVNELF